MEDRPPGSETKPLVPLSYATPKEDLPAAAEAFTLMAFFAVAALAVVFTVTALFLVRFSFSLDSIFTVLIPGLLEVSIGSGVLFLACWWRWRCKGSRLRRRAAWPFAVIFVIVIYASFFRLGYFILFGLFTNRELAAMIFVWPCIFGLLSPYFLLTRTDRLNS